MRYSKLLFLSLLAAYSSAFGSIGLEENTDSSARAYFSCKPWEKSPYADLYIKLISEEGFSKEKKFTAAPASCTSQAKGLSTYFSNITKYTEVALCEVTFGGSNEGVNLDIYALTPTPFIVEAKIETFKSFKEIYSGCPSAEFEKCFDKRIAQALDDCALKAKEINEKSATSSFHSEP